MTSTSRDPRWREKLKLQAVAIRVVDKQFENGFE
jgi:hypothetical protein